MDRHGRIVRRRGLGLVRGMDMVEVLGVGTRAEAEVQQRWFVSRVHDFSVLLTRREQPMSVEDFIRTFKAARKVYHKRAIWCERWSRGEVAWRED